MIKKLWSINLFETNLITEYGESFLKKIIEIGTEYEKKYPEAHVPHIMKTGKGANYNLLNDTSEEIQKYKKILKQYMHQMAEAEGFHDFENLKFVASTTIRRFRKNEYSKPHNHRDVDYVSVLFLQVGVTDSGEDIHQTMAGNRVHLIDPIMMKNKKLNHDMLKVVSPVEGTFFIHPSHIFHTTELNLSDTDLIALVTNIKVVDEHSEYLEL
jgi:hypothetical protein